MLSNIQSILKNKSKLLIICLILVSAISFLTYFYNYVNPPNLFWDENYHIASAYKYINHVFFMEPHPPLGKLFIAWGEQLFQSNNKLDTSSFAVTDYIKDIPNGFSFVGVRFFPALFGALSGPLFFLILYLLFPNVVLAFFFSFLYLFDNAIIVHSRGAMLDSSGIFFSLLVVLYFIVLQKKKIIPIASYGILGILTGLVLSVKINGIIFGMLFLFLLVKEIKYKMSLREEKRRSNLDGIAHNDIQIIQKTILYVLGVVVIFCAVYYIHISNGRNVMDNKYYEASERLKNVLAVHQTATVSNFPFQLIEHLFFIPHYEKGVPVLDVCKPDENGSHPLTWPLGNKSINYRWEKDGTEVRYLYLQGNPIIWGIGFVGILFSLVLFISRLVFKLSIKNNSIFLSILPFTSLYVVYMGLTLSLPRVLYLYHYFTPLIFSFILAYLQFIYIFENKIKKKSKCLILGVVVTAVVVVAAFILFSPFTYYLSLTQKQFQLRNWFSWWHLKAI